MRQFKRFIPYRDRPLCFFDIEGTGLIPGHHEVTEIGFLHTKKGKLNLQISPDHIERADSEALSISRYNTSDWAEAISFKRAASKIVEFMEDATIIGHNIFGYDIPILRGNFEMANISHDSLFRDCIDTMVLARAHLVPVGLKRLNMQSCMKFINESYDGAHNAYDDAAFAQKLYAHIIDNLKWHGTRDGKNIQETLF